MSSRIEDPFPGLSLAEALRAKGIGPRGNQSLTPEVLHKAFMEMAECKTPAAMEGAFVMAFRQLEQNPEEERAFHQLTTEFGPRLNGELRFLLGLEGTAPASPSLTAVIAKLLTGQDLDEASCEVVHLSLYDDRVSDRFKAALLQGLRIKRESDAENAALLKLLYRDAPHINISDDVVVDLCEPYDGCNRGPSLSLYLSLLLAEMGLTTITHGVKGLGPKRGQTAVHVLERLGVRAKLDFKTAARTLKSAQIACLDQEAIHPALAHLRQCRNDMLKRPYLATMEKCLAPVRTSGRLLLVCGYVHKDYQESLPRMMFAAGVCSTFMLVHGMEGGVLMDPRKKSNPRFGDTFDQFREASAPYAMADNKPAEIPVTDMAFAHQLLNGEHALSDALIHTAGWIHFAAGRSKNAENAFALAKDIMASGHLPRRLKTVISEMDVL